jgi:hypothetical protein
MCKAAAHNQLRREPVAVAVTLKTHKNTIRWPTRPKLVVYVHNKEKEKHAHQSELHADREVIP